MRDPFGSAAVEEEYSDEEGYDGSGGAEDGGNDEELVDLGALAEAELAEDDEEGDEEGDEDDDVEGEEDEDMEDADSEGAQMLVDFARRPSQEGFAGRGGRPAGQMQRGGGRILSSGLRVGVSNQQSPNGTPPQTPTIGRGGGVVPRGGRLGPGPPSGRGRGRGGGGVGVSPSPAASPTTGIPHEPLTEAQLSGLAQLAATFPENKSFFTGYVTSLQSGRMDLFTFLRKCFERLTKEQFANMERYLTENQKAVLPPDQRTKKRKPALGEGAPDSPSPQMGMGTPGGPAVKKARLEGPPGMAGRPGFGQPVRPSPLGQVSFAAGDSPGPRPPQPQPAQKAANKVNAEQLDEEFDSIKMAGVDVQEEHRLTGLDGQTDMVRYSSAPQSVLEARGVVKARMAEIASTADANLKVSDNAAVVLSDCLDGLLRTLIEKMVLASKHRNGLYRTMLEEDTARDVQSGNTAVEFVYVKTGDVKADIEARRNKERNKELEERRKVAELRNEEGGEDGVDMTKKAKKKLSARQLEASLPEEVKAANTRTAIDKSIGKTKTYSWLEGGGTKSEPLVPAVRPTPKPAAQGGLTAKELKREQRQEQHAKRLAKTVNVEDALLVLERDRRFRQSKAAMRWATWREARLLQGWPK